MGNACEHAAAVRFAMQDALQPRPQLELGMVIEIHGEMISIDIYLKRDDIKGVS